MFETFDRLMMAGLGALTMTKDRAEKIFDEYVKRGQAEQAGRSGFVKELLDSAERNRRELEDLIARQVSQTIAKTNLATREDIQRLEAKLEKHHAGHHSATQE